MNARDIIKLAAQLYVYEESNTKAINTIYSPVTS